MTKICELCGQQSDCLDESLILTSPDKLEDYKLCGECINVINEVKVDDEVETVRRLREKRGIK